ncbi:MAG: SDR family NAD(P)-dependent oxidoreductase [Gammaproteobacteria bacterium]|nr:MAG: SDR family NAD(P)-dependent oxidoreductase [Gammaproteobacteria bacterium]
MMNTWNIAFVTGGASGIGRRLVELLLADGVNVAVMDRSGNLEAQAELRALATGHRGRCEFYRADVADAVAVEDAVRQAVVELGKPDLAVNSAGVQNAKSFAELTADEFLRLVNINLVGSRNFAAAVLPHMDSGGQLALVASLAGLVPSYRYSAYNASKYGVVGLAGALRLECIERGIEVSVICPPEVNTPMVIEERKTMSLTSSKLKATAGTLEVGPACDYMLKQLRKRRFMIIPGLRARLVVLVARWLPNTMRRISEHIVLANVRSG